MSAKDQDTQFSIGARPLKRAIQRDLLDPLSMEILAGRFHENQTITADAREGKIVFVT